MVETWLQPGQGKGGAGPCRWYMGAVYERSCLLVHYDRVYATVHYFTIDEREAGLVLFWGVREPKSSHKKIIVEVP